MATRHRTVVNLLDPKQIQRKVTLAQPPKEESKEVTEEATKVEDKGEPAKIVKPKKEKEPMVYRVKQKPE